VEVGLYTDSVGRLGFEEALDFAAEIGCPGIEIAAGGQSPAPHMRVFDLVQNAASRQAFVDAFDRRGLRIAALNCSAWPLHPVVGDRHKEVIRATIRLAGQIGVTKIVTMSGTPGDAPSAPTVNWIWYPWPEDAVALLDRQWEETIRFWRDMDTFASEHGIERIAFELHPLHLVYNVPTLMRMREAIGPRIGANVDPSHMFWQQMDPIAVINALGPAVHHVHLKDTKLVPDQVAIAGVLDNRPFIDPAQRAWVFRTVGRGHDAAFWGSFVDALRRVGYDDVLSIENEDVAQEPKAGCTEAAGFMRQFVDAVPT
jgi:sugar phosphate isomerase/epimerase